MMLSSIYGTDVTACWYIGLIAVFLPQIASSVD